MIALLISTSLLTVPTIDLVIPSRGPAAWAANHTTDCVANLLAEDGGRE
jgi:hypothetical protein